jgi:hypothetical protein
MRAGNKTVEPLSVDTPRSFAPPGVLKTERVALLAGGVKLPMRPGLGIMQDANMKAS